MEPNQMPIEGAEDMGRATDNTLAHLTIGEVVIPLPMLSDPEIGGMIQQAFQAAGIDINEFTVGHQSNKINPETGYPEFFKLKKIFKAVAPIAAAYFAPGIGAALGSTLSAPTLGAIGGGLGGAVSGGGVKGAALGALGGYGLQGGFNDVIGSLPGVLQGPTASGAPLSGMSSGSGILGSVGRTLGVSSGDLPSIGGLVGGSGGGSTFGVNNIASALGGLQQDAALKKIKQQQLSATGQQLANLERLNPTDVQNDPGYQFTQAEGEKALNRSLGARGSLFSGAALKEAADYNQGLASRYYQDAYNRNQNQIGQQNEIYGNQGNIKATATMAGSNNLNQTIANALGANVGNYNGASLSNDQLLQLLRQRGLY